MMKVIQEYVFMGIYVYSMFISLFTFYFGNMQDKWKTLVHTASIAPHQRRGEPVPQALLDRVIRAHSYWTEQQAKQQTVENKIVVTL